MVALLTAPYFFLGNVQSHLGWIWWFLVREGRD